MGLGFRGLQGGMLRELGALLCRLCGAKALNFLRPVFGV